MSERFVVWKPNQHKNKLQFLFVLQVFSALNYYLPRVYEDMTMMVLREHTTLDFEKIMLVLDVMAQVNVFRNTIRYSGAHIWNNLLGLPK